MSFALLVRALHLLIVHFSPWFSLSTSPLVALPILAHLQVRFYFRELVGVENSLNPKT